MENGRGKVPHDPSLPFASTFSGKSLLPVPFVLYRDTTFINNIGCGKTDVSVHFSYTFYLSAEDSQYFGFNTHTHTHYTCAYDSGDVDLVKRCWVFLSECH